MTATTIESEAVLKKVYRAFFGPGKYEVKSADEAIIARGNNYRIPFEGGELAVTTWGMTVPPFCSCMAGAAHALR